MINPRHLRAFTAVAQAGSIARAASSLHRVPSSVTHAIKELESGLGVALFERRPHGMLLTEFGNILLIRARNVFQEMQTARQLMQAQASGLNAKAAVFDLNMGKLRLRTFVELIKHGHMGAAANALGISQPSVSQTLRDMECSLGVALVCRQPSGMVASPCGLLLATHLQHALTEIERTQEDMLSLRQGLTGHVRVGTLSLGRTRLLPRAILRTLRMHPMICVSTMEGSFEHLAALLRSAEIDFILGGIRPFAHMAGLTVCPVASSRISLLARRGHPWQQLKSQSAHLLTQAAWILPPPGTWTRTSLQASLAACRLPPPRVAVETADVTLIKALLRDSDMLTAASSLLFQHELETGELLELPVKLPAPVRDIGIIRRTGSVPGTAAQLLMNAILDATPQ